MGKIQQKAGAPLCSLCGVNRGAGTEAAHAALGAVLREPGLGRSLSLTLFSWTETHKDATEGSQRRKTGQKCLLSTTLDQPTKTAKEHARRVLGDELINNRTPRCLQTSVFSKVVAEIHKLFPQCQIPTGTPVSDPGRDLGDQPTHPLCFWLELR